MDKYPDMLPDFEKMRQEWYRTETVVFNVIANIKHKEACFYRVESGGRKGVMHRYLKINALVYLYKNFERYHFFEEPFNLYQSLAHLPDLPMMPFSLPKKEEEMSKFSNSFDNYIKGWDFFLDVDNPNLQLAYSTATKIKDILDEHKVIYSLRFSGKKGFHFFFDYNDFPESMKKLPFTELIEQTRIFAQNFKNTEQLKDLDLSVIDNRRICKTPYSVVYPEYLICLPLTDTQFDNWKIKEMSLQYNLENADKLYMRGNLKRKGKPENLQILMDKYLNINPSP